MTDTLQTKEQKALSKLQKETNQSHGVEMLKLYLGDLGRVYGLLTHVSTGRSSLMYYEVLTVYGGRIVNLSLYVANVLHLRRNKRGAVGAGSGFQTVAEMIGQAIGRPDIKWELL